MALLYGGAWRLTAKNGGFRPGQIGESVEPREVRGNWLLIEWCAPAQPTQRCRTVAVYLCASWVRRDYARALRAGALGNRAAADPGRIRGGEYVDGWISMFESKTKVRACPRAGRTP